MNPTNPTNPMNPLSVECVGVIGLGYVGLSLATAFGRVLPTIGFDIDHSCIRELEAGYDRTGPQLMLAHDPALLEKADFLIVSARTQAHQAKRLPQSNACKVDIHCYD